MCVKKTFNPRDPHYTAMIAVFVALLLVAKYSFNQCQTEVYFELYSWV